MDFIPKSNWQWVYDTERSQLTLQMGDYVIDIIYKNSMLALPDNQPIAFTVEDVARYTQLFESASLKGYQPEFACKIILHILAVDLFHKPIMPKSWWFNDSPAPASNNIDKMSHVTITAKGGNESAHYLVLEYDGGFVLCMLIDQIHQLTTRKSLAQFQIIKVTSDKLNLVKTSQENIW